MLSGKTAFITGSNRGIGKAILEKFLVNRAEVICAVRKIDDKFLDYINLQSKKFDKKIKVLEFDLKNENEIKKSIEDLYKKKINLDILVNNAGIPGGSLAEMTSIKSLRDMFEINFFSQIKVTQLLLRLLKKSNSASIINIGSVSGLFPERGNLMYGSSKAALMFATKVMAKEFSIYKIRVNAIAPTVTETDMLKKMDKNAKEKLLKESNLKEPISPNDVANEVLHLASEKSITINGQIIKIDGALKN